MLRRLLERRLRKSGAARHRCASRPLSSTPQRADEDESVRVLSRIGERHDETKAALAHALPVRLARRRVRARRSSAAPAEGDGGDAQQGVLGASLEGDADKARHHALAPDDGVGKQRRHRWGECEGSGVVLDADPQRRQRGPHRELCPARIVCVRYEDGGARAAHAACELARARYGVLRRLAPLSREADGLLVSRRHGGVPRHRVEGRRRRRDDRRRRRRHRSGDSRRSGRRGGRGDHRGRSRRRRCDPRRRLAGRKRRRPGMEEGFRRPC